jgi:hypothetical protein
MKLWKVAFGLGAACSACCAIPLLGISGAFVGAAAGLLACADEFIPLATALALFTLALAAVWFWRRRRALRSAACGCVTKCSMEASSASN